MSRTDLVLDIFPGLFPAGGIGRYVRDLCAALRSASDAPSYRFAYPASVRTVAQSRFSAGELHELPFGWRRMRTLCVLSARFGFPCDALYGHPLVFHAPLGYGPVFSGARTIANVHDLSFLEHPEWHEDRTAFFLSQTVPRIARRAERVLCHSRWVRDEVVRKLGVSAERCTVLPPPIGHDFHPRPFAESRARVASRFGLTGEFVLHVGTIEPRKDHARLVAAYEAMRRAGFPGPLVLVGREGWRVGPILERLAGSSEAANIVRLESVDEDDLVALYGACTVVAFASIEEGFGMPILEAMACGAPCVTGDGSAMAETGEGYATLVPPRDVTALADALLAVWRDGDARVRAAALGPARAAEYAHGKWAGRTFELYRSELAAARSASRA